MRLTLVLALVASALLPAAARADWSFYVSVGDSYAAGFQPARAGGPPDEGYADQLIGLARERGYDLRLLNFGCNGATTGSLLGRPGCPLTQAARHAVRYPRASQADAALAFLRRHRDRMGLVTVAVGLNDVFGCMTSARPYACAERRVPGVRANLATLLRRLRRAGGPGVRIVGTGYPNAQMGIWTRGTARARTQARYAQTVMRQYLNPALAAGYEAAGAMFVDATQATLGYLPLSGAEPAAIQGACAYTWFCEAGDIHATSAGYRVIAGLIAAKLPVRSVASGASWSVARSFP